MRMLVLGAGLQGTACAFDLSVNSESEVTLADVHPQKLPSFLASQKSRIDVKKLDVRDRAAVLNLMGEHDAVMSALPYYFNADMAALAVECGVHYADLGGNTQIVREQQALDDGAVAKGISVVLDCGLAPGMVNILAAEGMSRLDKVESVKLYAGGLPQNPEPPLNYQIAYSLEGVLDYYTTDSWVLRGGKLVEVEALTGLESVEFEDLGTLEAFHTAGGLSTMPWDYEGKVETMEYKTLRYPGHANAMRTIRDLGLLDLEPVRLGEIDVVPRDLFISTVDPILRKSGSPDLVVLRVVATGLVDNCSKEIAFELVDHHDAENAISAMMRTTGYSLALTGVMMVEGTITCGVHTAAECTPYESYVGELRKRGIDVQEI